MMSHPRRAPAALACLLVVAPAAFAQAPPLKWGEVPEAHLLMRDFAPDTNAAAVILADYGTVQFDDDYSLVFKRHRRIKILREAGYDWGTVRIPYYADGQSVEGVRGQTFTPGADGKAQRQAMDKSAVFRENAGGDYRQIRFTLPALAPGVVIEYQYTVRSNSPLYVPEWSFQTSEPTLWSEFRPEFPGILGYVQATRGILRFHINESEETTRARGDGKRYRLVMRDVPALREEPFMTTPENFRARLEYQLASFYDRAIGVRQVLSTWEELAKNLMEGDYFGRQLDRPRRNVRQQVEALVAGLENPVARMKAVYDHVRTNVTFTGEMGYVLDQDLDDVLKTQRGSSPEVALLLVSMLREAGLEAHPVLISTRRHGFIIEQYPLLSQFNDVLVHVTAGGTAYLLDATDPLRPHDLLPYEALNGRGWLVRKEGPRWIPIEAKGKYLHQVLVEATVTPEGTLSARLQASDAAYSALGKRRALKDDGAEAFVRDAFLAGLADVVLDSFDVAQADSIDAPLKTTAVFTAAAYAQAAGDFLYLNPTVLDRLEETPLRLPERTFPVDFGYPSDEVYTLRLALPAGYEVQEAPGPLRIALPSNGMTYTRTVEVKDGVLTVQARLVRAKAVFEPRQYAELRTFYEKLVAAHAEQVVLRKAAAAAGGE